MIRYIIPVLVVACCSIVNFYAGYHYRDNLCKIDNLEYQTTAQKQYLQSVQDTEAENKRRIGLVMQTANALAEQKKELEIKYNNAVSSLNNDRVHGRKNDTADDYNLSDSSRASERIARKSSNQCDAENSRFVKTNLMQIAKDCDNLALKYNSLLDLYLNVGN